MAGSANLIDTYQAIKNLEQTHFPVLMSRETLRMGIFDGSTGVFTPDHLWCRHQETEVVGGHPHVSTFFSTQVYAVDVGLQMVVVSQRGNLEVTIDNRPVPFPPNQNLMTIELGPSSEGTSWMAAVRLNVSTEGVPTEKG
jgi:hypothetical protein